MSQRLADGYSVGVVCFFVDFDVDDRREQLHG